MEDAPWPTSSGSGAAIPSWCRPCAKVDGCGRCASPTWGARPRLTPSEKARVEQQYPGAVDWAKVEAQLVARGGQVVQEDDYRLPEGPRPVLWAYFEALQGGLLFADERAPWAQDAPPPSGPSAWRIGTPTATCGRGLCGPRWRGGHLAPAMLEAAYVGPAHDDAVIDEVVNAVRSALGEMAM